MHHVVDSQVLNGYGPTPVHNFPGLSEGAVAMRLHRGKLALRRVLATDLAQDAAAYGLIDEAMQEWQETRIWCSSCGQRRYMGAFNQRTVMAAAAPMMYLLWGWPYGRPRDGASGVRTRACGRSPSTR
jgi:hypothetical protein